MNPIAMVWPQLVPVATMCGLVLASVALSILTLARAQALLRAARSNMDDIDPTYGSAIESLRQQLQALQKQAQDARQHPPNGVLATVPVAPLGHGSG